MTYWKKRDKPVSKYRRIVAQELESFLTPLLIMLGRSLDKRLVRTFVQCCIAIIRFRNSKQALLLSELGSYLDGVRGLSTSAKAVTKRLGNLILSIKWTVGSIDQFLLEEADREVKKLKLQGKRILCIVMKLLRTIRRKMDGKGSFQIPRQPSYPTKMSQNRVDGALSF